LLSAARNVTVLALVPSHGKTDEAEVAFPPEFDFEDFLQYYQEGRSCPFVVYIANTGINKRYELGESHYQRNDFRRFQRLAGRQAGCEC
jgi:hypothetical protein